MSTDLTNPHLNTDIILTFLSKLHPVGSWWVVQASMPWLSNTHWWQQSYYVSHSRTLVHEDRRSRHPAINGWPLSSTSAGRLFSLSKVVNKSLGGINMLHVKTFFFLFMESYLKQSAWKMYNDGPIILVLFSCPAPWQAKMKELFCKHLNESSQLSTGLILVYYSSIPV